MLDASPLARSRKNIWKFLKFSGAAAVSGIRFIFGRLFAIWRESQKPLLARRKASKRPNGPARESCRPRPMSVTLPPARSGPPDRIGVRLEHDRRGSRSGPPATVETIGNTAIVYITGIDTAEDLVKIFAVVRKTGATRAPYGPAGAPVPRTWYAINNLYESALAASAERSTQLAEDTFRLYFDEWPRFD